MLTMKINETKNGIFFFVKTKIIQERITYFILIYFQNIFSAKSSSIVFFFFLVFSLKKIKVRYPH